MKKRFIFVCAAALTALSAAALAHGGATGIVKERMDAMSAMGAAVKSISMMITGATPYDAQIVKSGAAVIQSHAGDALTGLFPEGSQQMASEARPEIWSDWQDFQTLSLRLETLAQGLKLAADNGPIHDSESGPAAMMGSSGSKMMGTEGSMMMGDSGMMGEGSGMGSGMGSQVMEMIPEQLANMPVDGVFNMLTRTCSACHTRFRLEKK